MKYIELFKAELGNKMKKKTLLLYSTTDGQTIAICKRIRSTLIKYTEVDIVSLDNLKNFNLTNYKQVIIGASIRYGKHKPELYEFIRSHKDELHSKTNGFFSVNVVARKSTKNLPGTNPYVRKFLQISSWKPTHLAVFAGKLNYPKYGFLDKQMIRLIMLITKGPTDTKGVFEFTNWDQVDQFALKFVDSSSLKASILK